MAAALGGNKEGERRISNVLFPQKTARGSFFVEFRDALSNRQFSLPNQPLYADSNGENDRGN